MRRMLAGLRLPEEDAFDVAAASRIRRPRFRRTAAGSRHPSRWLTQAELDHYVAEFTRTGFTGGINWYRNFDRNWALTERSSTAPR